MYVGAVVIRGCLTFYRDLQNNIIIIPVILLLIAYLIFHVEGRHCSCREIQVHLVRTRALARVCMRGLCARVYSRIIKK
jgi:hypothetical protein